MYHQKKILRKRIEKRRPYAKSIKHTDGLIQTKLLTNYGNKIKNSFKFTTNIKNKQCSYIKKKLNQIKTINKLNKKDGLWQLNDYNHIKEIPIYRPTIQEFHEPLLLIKKLRKLGYESYGAVKIKPPNMWKPEFYFNEEERKITTRKQVIQDLCKGKCFEQNIEAYTLKQYQNFAKKFELEQIKNIQDHQHKDFLRTNEYRFWSMVDNAQNYTNPITVEYAADLPSKKYGNTLLTETSNIPHTSTNNKNALDEQLHNFNLHNINNSNDSLFKIFKKINISGITSPWIYLGMLYASFCWHVEDNFMYSVNYLHKGAPKTWYIVPGDSRVQFEEVIKKKYTDIFAKRPHILYNIILQMNPLELINNNVPIYRTDQHQNEYIITFPKAYHSGFSHGFNAAEAVNIAPIDWLDAGKEAIEDYALNGYLKKAAFPHEWIAVENVRCINESQFSDENREAVNFHSNLLKHYEIIKQNELKKRHNAIKTFKITKNQKFAKEDVRYDMNICKICRNYTYLSFLECNKCNNKACIFHNNVCDCSYPELTMQIRYTDQELNQFSQLNKTSSKKQQK